MYFLGSEEANILPNPALQQKELRRRESQDTDVLQYSEKNTDEGQKYGVKYGAKYQTKIC
jgi:hypothetical protein